MHVNKESVQFLQCFILSRTNVRVDLLVQTIWALGSSFEILMAYLIIPRAGWRILVLVSALPMILTFFASLVCVYS